LMQEEGSYKVLVYLSIPGLKLKRSFINFFKFVPSNGHVKVLNFQNESITFMIDLQTKSYSISVARLPEEIQPEHCSIKYQRDGCRIILIKLEPTPWMNIISNDLSPELDIQGDDDQSPTVSAPSRSSQPTRKKVSALVPPPPFNVVPLASSSSSHPTKKRSQHHRYQVNIYSNLYHHYFVKQKVLSSQHVYELQITLGSNMLEIINESHTRKKFILQFIYHPSITSIETYLMAFDLDIIQMCFNGEKVSSTWACICAFNTGMFICYNLTNNLPTLARSVIRISKYYQKKFKLLYPYQFEIDDFLSLAVYQIEHTQNHNYYSSTKKQFGSNHDYFELQKKICQYIYQ
ncbi:unnamed protein product, partial [Rotaria magnacalcarata]